MNLTRILPVGSSIAEAVMKLAHDQSIPVMEFEPVKDMPSNKSPGIDKVSINVLKDCLAVVSKRLTD